MDIELAATASGNLGRAINAFCAIGGAGKKLLARLGESTQWKVSTLGGSYQASEFVRSNSHQWPVLSSRELEFCTRFVQLYASLSEQDRNLLLVAIGSRQPTRITYSNPKISETCRTETRKDGTVRVSEVSKSIDGGRIELEFSQY